MAVTVRSTNSISPRSPPSMASKRPLETAHIPRATPSFERLYKGRTAVERVNDRFKVLWGVDDGNVVGARRFSGHVSAVLLVHMACATLLAKAQRKEGTFGTLRLSPIAQKLADLTAAERHAPLE